MLINGARLAIVVPLLLALISGSFYLGSEIDSNRVEHLTQLAGEYEKSAELNLSETITALRLASDEFSLSVFSAIS